MRKYAYAILDDHDCYDLDAAFYDSETAVKALVSGDYVVVLDALSFEYLGTLELH